MIVALNTGGETGPVLECFRAGVDDYLFPPLAEGLKKGDRTPGRRSAGDRTAESLRGKLSPFFSAKGGCGATTLACHVAVALSRLN